MYNSKWLFIAIYFISMFYIGPLCGCVGCEIVTIPKYNNLLGLVSVLSQIVLLSLPVSPKSDNLLSLVSTPSQQTCWYIQSARIGDGKVSPLWCVQLKVSVAFMTLPMIQRDFICAILTTTLVTFDHLEQYFASFKKLCDKIDLTSEHGCYRCAVIIMSNTCLIFHYISYWG